MSSLRSDIQYDALHPRDHQRIARFIGEQAGIQLPEHKRNLIETRLRKRQRALGYQTLRDYVGEALTPGSDETLFLIDALTTNKTEFFREASHYEWYTRYLKENGRAEPIHIWSAGCSSGEEPYTLSMLAMEERADVRIVATDISCSMLELARRAIYLHKTVTPVPLALRNKYLLRRKTDGRDEVKIARAVREKVRFDEFNLITDDFAAMPRFDMIFCRNVMIYFNTLQRQQLVDRFYRQLKPGGMFFIGHSESLKDTAGKFDIVVPTVYLRGA